MTETGWQRRDTGAVIAMVIAFAVLYFKPFVDLVGIWLNDDNVSYSFVLLPVMVYLVWQRRGRLASTERRPSLLGLAIVVASLAVLLVGTAGVEFFLMRTSAVGVIVGSVLFLAGWQWLRILAFPIALSLLVIPIPPVIFYQMTFPLQVMATKFGVSVLQMFQIPVLREGNVIWLAHTTLEVTEACSGIRSLLSLFSLAILYAYFTETNPIVRVVTTLMSIPIAVLANGLRIAGTGVAAQYVGPEAATGFFHSFQGWVMFMVSLAMLMAVTAIVRRVARSSTVQSSAPSFQPSVS